MNCFSMYLSPLYHKLHALLVSRGYVSACFKFLNEKKNKRVLANLAYAALKQQPRIHQLRGLSHPHWWTHGWNGCAIHVGGHRETPNVARCWIGIDEVFTDIVHIYHTIDGFDGTTLIYTSHCKKLMSYIMRWFLTIKLNWPKQPRQLRVSH